MIFEALRFIKQEKGLSSADLARATGEPVSTIRRIVSGQYSNPPWETMCAIARALDTPLDFFADVHNQRIIRISENTHMGRYRALDPARKAKVDEVLALKFEEWREEMDQSPLVDFQRRVVDAYYSLNYEELGRVLDFIKSIHDDS